MGQSEILDTSAAVSALASAFLCGGCLSEYCLTAEEHEVATEDAEETEIMPVPTCRCFGHAFRRPLILRAADQKVM